MASILAWAKCVKNKIQQKNEPTCQFLQPKPESMLTYLQSDPQVKHFNKILWISQTFSLKDTLENIGLKIVSQSVQDSMS